MPTPPASRMWLLAIPTQSSPASESPLVSLGFAEKTVPDVWYRKTSGAGFSKFAIAMSAELTRSRTAPALPVLFVYGVSHPSGEQSLQTPVTSAVPPLNGKSAPLPL